jgi:hypothetical protein
MSNTKTFELYRPHPFILNRLFQFAASVIVQSGAA